MFTGVTNDVLTKMEKEIFFAAITEFFKENKFVRGGMCGGLFHGRMLRRMLEPTMLQRMSCYLGSFGDSYIAYLHSIRELYSVLARKEYDLENAWQKVVQYKKCFQDVHDKCGLSETPKESIQKYIMLTNNLLTRWW